MSSGAPVLARRAVLACAAAAIACPARAQDAALRDLLAELAARPEAGGPATALKSLAALRRLDVASLSPAARLEWRVAHEGLSRELEIARWPAGRAPYALLLAHALGKPMPPELAHRKAANEVRRLQQRAEALLAAHGLSRGSVGDRLRTLAEQPRFLFSDDEDGRNRAIAEMNGWLAAVRPKLARAFGDLPIPNAVVRRMSRQDEAARRSGYRALSNPDRGAAAYYVDLSRIGARPSWSLASVVHHETLPGHLLQQTLQAAASPPALRTRFAGAYGEAWAIYAEQLTLELGAFRTAPLAELGFVQWRLFRMGRVLADTGLHARGWTAVEAVAALRDIQGFDAAFVSVEEDVAHMADAPGKVAAEGLGALEFARLRRGARDLAAFHRAALAAGPWPFGVLPEVVA